MGGAVVYAEGKVLTKLATAHHLRQRREGLGGHPPAPIGFDHGNFQVAIGAVGVKVIDHKRPGGNVEAVHQVIILADFNGCVGLGITANDRRITALAVWQHGVIGIQQHAIYTHAVEDFRVGIGRSQGQLALE